MDQLIQHTAFAVCGMKHTESAGTHPGFDRIATQVVRVIQPALFKTLFNSEADLLFNEFPVLKDQIIGYPVNVGSEFAALIIAFRAEAPLTINTPKRQHCLIDIS
jgi:hypothetical protein